MRLFGGTDLVLYFFFYAFAAWVLETLFFSLKKQRFVNCGILDLPLLLSHGAAMANLILVSSGEMPERSRFLFGFVQTVAIGYLSEVFAERLLRKKKLRTRQNQTATQFYAALIMGARTQRNL